MRAKEQVVTGRYSLADYLRQTSKKQKTAGRIRFEDIIQLVAWNPDYLGWRGADRRCRIDMVVNQTGPAECLPLGFYNMGHVAVFPDGQLNTSLSQDV